MGKRKNRSRHRTSQGPGGSVAKWQKGTLRSYNVGALPIINHILERMNLEEILAAHLPGEDARTKIPTSRGVMLLVRNILIAREPLYGLGEWASRYAPDLLGLDPEQVMALNDDRSGRWLTKYFLSEPATIGLAATTRSVHQFDVDLDELHNDSTTVTFHGAYHSADREMHSGRQLVPAITFGHNKDHRPDLKQLLYILTLSHDGAVPVHFRVCSGNVTDDTTHRETWNVLRQLVGHPDFLYVADCKLATSDNMVYLHGHGGRFVTVLPQTRKEDDTFRKQLAEGAIHWRPLWDKLDEHDQLVDRFSISDAPTLTAEGFRLIWYHSTRKAELDAAARATSIRRSLLDLGVLRETPGSTHPLSRSGEDSCRSGHHPQTVRRDATDSRHPSGNTAGNVSPGPSRSARPQHTLHQTHQALLRSAVRNRPSADQRCRAGRWCVSTGDQ